MAADGMTFDIAFERLIGHEGGYTPGKGDPGGETKFGISKRSYPGEDIPNLTLDRARAIYKTQFWGAAGCDAVPDALRFDLFDMAVNAGVRPAIRCLQTAAGAVPDGIIGPDTLLVLSSAQPLRVLARFAAARLNHYTSLPTWPAFGKGWARRIAANLLEA